MPISKKRKPKTNYYGARKNELATWGIEIARYPELLMKTDYKNVNDSELSKLLFEIKSYEGFLGIHATGMENDIFAEKTDIENYYCVALFDTPEHRNYAYEKINGIEGYTKDQLKAMTEEEIIKKIKVLLVLQPIYVKKKYL